MGDAVQGGMIRELPSSVQVSMPLNRTIMLAVSAAVFLGNAEVSAQTNLTPNVRSSVIDSLAARLERSYVDADTGRMISNVVRRQLRSGAYDTIRSEIGFAEQVTRDLRSVNGDLHLNLRLQPASSPGAAGAGNSIANHGIVRVEVMPGNIGYMEIHAFQGSPGYEKAIVDALAKLEDTNAIIIDVRRHRGGSSQMSHLLFSHFLPAQPIETIRVVDRNNGVTIRRSVQDVPGPRRTDVPLYVLTSQYTGSAGEEFTFVLRNQKRATIVGDRTAGAGHMVNSFPVGHGFSAGVSITRVSDPRTGAEWEIVGVSPDIKVPSEDALDVAYAAARRGAPEKGNPVP